MENTREYNRDYNHDTMRGRKPGAMHDKRQARGGSHNWRDYMDDADEPQNSED